MTKKMAAGGEASSYKDMTAGSGSGLGRLQKTSIASKTTTQKLKKGGIARMDKGGKPPTDETPNIMKELVRGRDGKMRPVSNTEGDRIESGMKGEDARLERAYNLRDAAERNRTGAAVADFYGTVHPFGRPKDRTNRARNQGYLDKAERDVKDALTRQEVIARTGNATKVEGMEGLMGMKDGYYKNGVRDSRYAKGGVTKMAKGGKAEAFEGSAKDMAQDKKLAKKYGMSMGDYEKSSVDAKHDKQRSMKGLKMGGKAKMAAGGMSTSQDGMKAPLRPKPTAMAMGGYAKGGKAEMHDKGCKCMACGGKAKYAKGGKVTFGSMKPLPGTKTVGPTIRPTVETGASLKKDGMKGQLRAKASGAKPTNMMKPLGMTKMAKGGKVRGTGIAQRGTKFIGEV